MTVAQQEELFGVKKEKDGLHSACGEVIYLASKANVDKDAVWNAGRIKTDDDDIVRFVGPINVKIGDHVKIVGVWEPSEWGDQLRVSFSAPIVSPAALQKVLERDKRFSDIGPVRSKKIVGFLVNRSLSLGEVLRDDSLVDAMRSAASLTDEAIESLRQFWIPLEKESETKAALIALGVPYKSTEQVWNALGEYAIQTVKRNPYDLVEIITGFTLKSADEIAVDQMGITKTDDRRITCGIARAIDKMPDEGHTWITQDKLLGLAAGSSFLTLTTRDERDAVKRKIADLTSDGSLTLKTVDVFGQVICQGYTLNAETEIMRAFSPSNKDRTNSYKALDEGWIDALSQKLNPPDGVTRTPSAEQRAALELFVKYKTIVITGAAGTGKTLTISMIVAACQHLGLKVAMAAPTGKAAKRMLDLIQKNGVDTTGVPPPKTIHLMLGYNGTEFTVNQIEADVVILDESSMIGVGLMSTLLKTLGKNTALVLVGDHNQLPSVEAGAVLRDLVEGQMVHVARLGTVFRNAGPLRANAFEILNRGIMKPTTTDETGQTPWEVNDKLTDHRKCVDVITAKYTQLLRASGEAGLFDIQVLAGKLDVVATLNLSLRKRAHEILYGRFEHHDPEHPNKPTIGDKVIQTRNNYKLRLMNGEQGVIVAIGQVDDQSGKHAFSTLGWTLRVQGGGTVSVPMHQTRDFLLAYAITTHRFQGSDCAYVLCDVHSTQGGFLNRSLLYTMSTRATKKVMFFGDRKGTHESLKVVSEKFRRTLTMPKHLLLDLKKRNASG